MANLVGRVNAPLSPLCAYVDRKSIRAAGPHPARSIYGTPEDGNFPIWANFSPVPSFPLSGNELSPASALPSPFL